MGLTVWKPLQPANRPGLRPAGGRRRRRAHRAGAGRLAFWLAGYFYLAAQLLGRVRAQVAALEQPR